MHTPSYVASRFNVVVHLGPSVTEGMQVGTGSTRSSSTALQSPAVAIYNTASGALIKLPEPVWKQVGQADGTLPEEVAGELIARGIVVPRDFDEIASAKLRFDRARYAGKSLDIIIAPTMACNLRCAYCFEGLAQEEASVKKMSREVEAATIRWVAGASSGKQSVHITWYGGEPLLALPTISRMSAMLPPALDACGVRYSSSLITNGTKLTPEVAERLARCRVTSAQVTVDVPPVWRVDRRGRPAVAEALAGAESALAAGLKVSLRVNVLSADEGAFDSLYQQILDRGLGRALEQLDFHRVRCPEAPRKATVFDQVLSPSRFEKLTLRERRKALRLGLPVTTLCLTRSSLCQAVRDNSAVIGPDGSLYKCMEEVGLAACSHGSVLPAASSKDAVLVRWLRYDWFSHPQCADCVLLPQCAGGCPHRRLFAPGRLPPDDFCFLEIRANLEDRIRLYAEYGPRGNKRASREP